jgi:hypothetical protein
VDDSQNMIRPTASTRRFRPSIPMFKVQIISCASLLLLYPSSSLVVIIAILSVRIFAPFTPLYPFFPAIATKVIHRIGVLVFLSATAILAVHLNLWMLRISLMWIHGHIYSIIPGYNRWIWAIQLCGLAIIVYPRSWVVFLSDPTNLRLGGKPAVFI